MLAAELSQIQRVITARILVNIVSSWEIKGREFVSNIRQYQYNNPFIT